MDADKKLATIAIQWSQPDTGLRALMAEQFLQFKALLRDLLGREWIWDMDGMDEYGKPICRIYTSLKFIVFLKRMTGPSSFLF
jgi:hypothetical protein